MTYHDHIARDPHVCGGQPVVRGTRVPLRVILAHLAHGETVEHIVKEFPTVTAEDVRAAIAFAAASARGGSPRAEPRPARCEGCVKIKLDENIPASAAPQLGCAGI